MTDEQGRPIGGVKVEIWGYLGEKKQKDELAYHVDATTDDQGRWRCRCFRDMTFAYLYLSHPDFLNDGCSPACTAGRFRRIGPQPGEKPMQGLRDFSDAQVLTRGVEIAGEVRDKEGKPIADAEVGWLDAGTAPSLPQLHVPDDDGLERPLPLPARASRRPRSPGQGQGSCARSCRLSRPSEDADPVTIVLGPSQRLAGRVVDSRGKTNLRSLRRDRHLAQVPGTRRLSRDRRRSVASNGRTPRPDSVFVNASTTGFDHLIHREVSPGEEALFTLKRSLAISGRIRDAKTKKAIDNVNVTVGTPGSKPGSFDWRRNHRVFARQDGSRPASISSKRPNSGCGSGSRDTSRSSRGRSTATERQVEYDVELTPTDKPDGVVVTGGRLPTGREATRRCGGCNQLSADQERSTASFS